MTDDKFLFIDFDDTLSDPFRFQLQYVREIGAILAPKYGGEVEAWAKSGIDMLEALEKDYAARFVGNPLAGYCAWLETVRVRSVELLFRGMRLPVPANAEQLSVETQFSALLMCDSTFPGALEALTTLFEEGYRVQIASGQESQYLIAALMGAGIESYTESKFGPDLIDCAKEGPEYFERMFAATGVDPKEALVVDDFPPVIEWALQTGAKVIQSRLSVERHHDTVPGVAAVLTDLRALPDVVKEVQGRCG
jgi:FMN phosphatase YigB (HAD superfamily)